jgi:hypothetical protein
MGLVFVMDHLPHLIKHAIAEPGKTPDTGGPQHIPDRHMHRDAPASSQEVEVLQPAELALDVQPLGHLLQGIRHEQDHRHRLCQPQDQVS